MTRGAVQSLFFVATSARRAIYFALSVLSLLWVAIYNGYPLVWWDTGAYVQSSFDLEVPTGRPVFYGLFLLATHWRLTLWGAVVAQSALVVYLLGRLVDDGHCAGAGTKPRDLQLLALCVCLAVGTAVPWLVGEVMADVFTGVAVLSLYALTLSQTARRGDLGLALLLVLSLVVHFEHLPLVIALTALMQVGAWAGRPRLRVGALRLAWACIAIAVMLVPMTNWMLTGRAFFSGSSHVFIVGRLFRDGIVQRLLADHCAERDYQFCAYRHELPRSMGEYIWSEKSPFQRIGGWYGSEAESWRVIRDAVVEYPANVLAGTARAALLQLQMTRTAADLDPFLDGTGTNDALQRSLPNEYRRYRASRQQSDDLPRAAFAEVHRWVLLCSVLLSVAIVAAAVWRGSAEAVRLHAFVWLAVIVNAVVIGLISEPDHRFGARIAWLIPASVLLSLAHDVNTRRAARARRRWS